MTQKCASSSTPSSKTTSPSSSTVELKPKIGLWAAISIVVGEVVGAGIFVSAQGVLAKAQSPIGALGVWLFAGFLSLLGALCFAELAMMVPRSGGIYIYVKTAFGPLSAFLVLWSLVIALIPASICIAVQLAADYLLYAFVSSDSELPATGRHLMATCLLFLLCFVNCVSIKWGTRFLKVTCIGKCLALSSVILLALYYFCKAGDLSNLEWHNMTERVGEKEFELVDLSLAFFQAFYSYGGYQNLTLITDEIKRPIRTVPLALIISMPLIALIYIAVNISYLVALTPAEIIQSPILSLTFLSRVLQTTSIWPRLLVSTFIILACVGFAAATLLTNSRLLYVGARSGQFPEVFAMLNTSFMTPMISVMSISIIATALIHTSGYRFLINYIAFTAALLVALTISAQLKLRLYDRINPDSPKYPLIIPITYFIVSLWFIITPFFTDPMEVVFGAVVFCTGVPVYLIFVKYRQRLDWIDIPSEDNNEPMPRRDRSFSRNALTLCQFSHIFKIL